MSASDNRRLVSLDTLRGFDMMLIMGLGGLIYSICGALPCGTDCWLAQQMNHVSWNGFRIFDTIFPLFLFIAGISFPFSYAKQIDNGATRCKIHKKIIVRGLVLVLLGLIHSGMLQFKFDTLRFYSVLGRIGLAWMFAALIYVNVRKTGRIIISAVILVGYCLLLCLVAAPDAPAGTDPLSLEGNLVGYVDRMLWPNHLLNRKVGFDPEGLLSTLPAIVTALLGMFTGDFIRSAKYDGKQKTLYMLAAAVVLLVLGLVWSRIMPVNKKLWSSSFVLVAGAYSLFMFSIFYWVIDVKGWDGWVLPFKAFGMNSITIYMLTRIISATAIAKFFLGGVASLLPEAWADVVLNAGIYGVCIFAVMFLYNHKIFLKV